MGLFFIVLRTIAIPIVAYLLLRESPIGEEGAVIAIGIALTIITLISAFWTFLKVVGNTLLLRGKAVFMVLLSFFIQIVVVLFVWGYYIVNFTDLI